MALHSCYCYIGSRIYRSNVVKGSLRMSGARKLARMSVMSIWPESGEDSVDERRQGDSMFYKINDRF